MDAVELKEYIINNDKLLLVLETLGCYNIKEHKKHYSCSTPKNTKSLSTAIYKDNLKVKVYAEGDKVNGDILTLTMYLKDCRFGKAIKILHKTLGLKYYGVKIKKEEDSKFDLLKVFNKIKSKTIYQREELNIIEEDITKEYIKMPYIEWVREGILPKTQDIFGVGYSSSSNRVVFPHRYWCGDSNEYVGLIGRTLVKEHDRFGIPKYFPLYSYLKSNNLYGLQENYQGIQESGFVTVFEAEKSVMKRHSKLDYTGVALCCHELSEEQARILISLNVPIIIALDKGIDRHFIRSICEKFYGIRPVYYIWDEYDLLDDKESPADKHEKIYKTLFKRKIKYTEDEHNKYLKTKEELENK